MERSTYSHLIHKLQLIWMATNAAMARQELLYQRYWAGLGTPGHQARTVLTRSVEEHRLEALFNELAVTWRDRDPPLN